MVPATKHETHVIAGDARAAIAGLRSGRAVDAAPFAAIVRTMGLDHHKWDAQVGDVAALASFPIVLSRATRAHLESLAEALAAETVAMEEELAHRCELHRTLGLHGELARLFASRALPSPAAARIMRFDFHPTTEGWRPSEVNSDVPGGFTESSRFSALIAAHTREGECLEDPADAWIDAITRDVPPAGNVALLSAPGWVEDTQIVLHLASRIRARGFSAYVASPHHLRWPGGHAHLASDFAEARLDAVLRFYQAEWMADIAPRDAWIPLFFGGKTPVTNPARAALSESKRAPLVWSELDAPSETWRAVLPETRDPRDAPGLWRRSADWVLKPAYGNTGDDVTLGNRSSRAGWSKRVALALARPRQWVAQRRFSALAIETPFGAMHLCVGVYVVDGVAAGMYGRLSPSRVIDHTAIDVAVLVES